MAPHAYDRHQNFRQTLGIIGYGRIGQEMAKRAHLGFGMDIVVQNRSKVSPDVLAVCKARQVDSVEDLMAQSDFVSLHCPGGDVNRHLINADRLAAMRPGGFLINTARGEVVDDAALAASIASGHTAGAGLDVFDGEPNISPQLMSCKNLVMLPHLGSGHQRDTGSHGISRVGQSRRFLRGPPTAATG